MSRPVDHGSSVTQPPPPRSTGCIVFLLVLLNLQLLVFTVPAIGLFLAWNKLEGKLDEVLQKGKLQLQEELTRRVQPEKAQMQRDLTEVIRQERAKMQRELTEVVQRERVKTETAVREILEKSLPPPPRGKRGE